METPRQVGPHVFLHFDQPGRQTHRQLAAYSGWQRNDSSGSVPWIWLCRIRPGIPLSKDRPSIRPESSALGRRFLQRHGAGAAWRKGISRVAKPDSFVLSSRTRPFGASNHCSRIRRCVPAAGLAPEIGDTLTLSATAANPITISKSGANSIQRSYRNISFVLQQPRVLSETVASLIFVKGRRDEHHVRINL